MEPNSYLCEILLSCIGRVNCSPELGLTSPPCTRRPPVDVSLPRGVPVHGSCGYRRVMHGCGPQTLEQRRRCGCGPGAASGWSVVVAGGIRGLSLCLGLMRSKAGASRRLRPLSAWPGDTISPLEQSRAFFELWLRSRAHRCSLEEASTLDICWNGPSDRSPLP